MNNTDFILEKQKAIERMKEFYSNSPPDLGSVKSVPPFVKLGEDKPPRPNAENNSQKSPFSFNLEGLNLPFLNDLKTNGDLGLILGLVLLLVCENTDKLTLIALLYILL